MKKKKKEDLMGEDSTHVTVVENRKIWE